MKVKYSVYSQEQSLRNIREILNDSDNSYPKKDGVPSRESLTYNNGYYVDITILFIDIRDSKKLSENHTRPVLAKIYRAYISEVIAIMRGNTRISEIFIEGDGLWAVYDTLNNEQVQSVLTVAGKISSLIRMLNKKLVSKKYSSLKVGIGIEDGESLYMQAGYKGSSIKEVVWIGKAVGESAKLCNFGNRTNADGQIMISERVYSMLSKHQQTLFEYNYNRECYHGNVVNTPMEEYTKRI